MLRLLAIAIAIVIASTAVAQSPNDGGRRKLQGCQVIARIDNQAILASDILWQVELIIADNMDRIPPQEVDAARQQLIESQLRGVIDTKLIFGDFRREARGADMNAIRKQLDKPFFDGGSRGDAPGSVPGLMKVLQVQSLTELEERLAELGTSLSARKEAYIEQAIAQTWVQQKVNVAKPTYAELSDYYQEHLEEYAFPTQAKWEELTVDFKQAGSKQAAKQKIVEAGNVAWQAWQQNQGSREPLFTDLAPKYSDGYNADEGGLYDWTTQGALVNSKLDAALFSLPIGSLSPIIESQSAYHIVRVVDRRQAGHTPFAEVQDAIREKIMNDEFRAKTDEYISELRRKTKIWTIYSGNTTAEAFLRSSDKLRR